MSMALPLVGAAMPTLHLDNHLEWLLADQRDLEIQDFAMPSLLDGDGWKTSVETVKSKLDGHTGRMGLHAPFWNITLAAYDSKIRAAVVDRFKQTLDIAGELGATHMVLHSPLDFLGAPSSLLRPTIGSESLFNIVHETLKDIVPMAEAMQCTLVIENIYDKHPLMLTELVKSFNSEYVRQSLDTGHAFINYVQGAPPPDYWVKEAGDLLAHVHLQDTDGYTDRHWTIGEGDIAWGELFAALGNINSNPRLIIEIREYESIPKAAAWLAERGLAR